MSALSKAVRDPSSPLLCWRLTPHATSHRTNGLFACQDQKCDAVFPAQAPFTPSKLMCSTCGLVTDRQSINDKHVNSPNGRRCDRANRNKNWVGRKVNSNGQAVKQFNCDEYPACPFVGPHASNMTVHQNAHQSCDTCHIIFPYQFAESNSREGPRLAPEINSTVNRHKAICKKKHDISLPLPTETKYATKENVGFEVAVKIRHLFIGYDEYNQRKAAMPGFVTENRSHRISKYQSGGPLSSSTFRPSARDKNIDDDQEGDDAQLLSNRPERKRKLKFVIQDDDNDDDEPAPRAPLGYLDPNVGCHASYRSGGPLSSSAFPLPAKANDTDDQDGDEAQLLSEKPRRKRKVVVPEDDDDDHEPTPGAILGYLDPKVGRHASTLHYWLRRRGFCAPSPGTV